MRFMIVAFFIFSVQGYGGKCDSVSEIVDKAIGIQKRFAKVGTPESKKLAQKFLNGIEECLTKKNGGCKQSSLDRLAEVATRKWDEASLKNDFYFDNLIKNIKKNPEGAKAKRATLSIVSESVPKKGKFSGTPNYQSVGGGKFKDRDGNIVSESEIQKSFLREDKAAKLLRRLGHNVTQVSEDLLDRRKAGVDDLYDSLRKAEDLGPTRTPDLILNDKVLVDVFSPDAGVRKTNIDTVVDGVLKKSETNRQTNRVAIYTDQISGSRVQVVENIRKKLMEKKPENLEEAFIVFEESGKSMILNVWP